MHSFVDDRPRPRDFAWRMRTALAERQEFRRRRACMACGRVRDCVMLELLAHDERWYCITECWGYHLGVLHGRRTAVRDLRALIDGFAA
jgi:hypothetical protein